MGDQSPSSQQPILRKIFTSPYKILASKESEQLIIILKIFSVINLTRGAQLEYKNLNLPQESSYILSIL